MKKNSYSGHILAEFKQGNQFVTSQVHLQEHTAVACVAWRAVLQTPNMTEPQIQKVTNTHAQPIHPHPFFQNHHLPLPLHDGWVGG